MNSVLPASVHLVGIGGGHMSAIAQVLHARGVRVSGSDQARTAVTERLAALGIRVAQGHAAANLGDVDLVVATAAVKSENPELAEATRRGIPVIARAEMVARLMQGRRGVAVAGTHGKTTTSSMIAFILLEAGRDPLFLIGADAPDLGGNAGAGDGPEVVVEADEYARAFHAYTPDIAVVLNVEADHLEYYGSVEAYEQAFGVFLTRVPDHGLIVACADSPRLVALVERGVAAPVHWYRLAAGPGAPPPPQRAGMGWTAVDHGPAATGERRFSAYRDGGHVLDVALRIPGAHNVANALAAIAACTALGLTPEQIAGALARFRGASRRQELLGEADGVTFVDDFGHHPTEIAVTIQAVRDRYPGHRLLVVFQPHTFSRTSYLFDAFLGCFGGADDLTVLDTYASRETPDAGMAARDLAVAITRPTARFAMTADGAVEDLSPRLRPGDVLLTIGAGDVDRVGRALLGRRTKVTP